MGELQSRWRDELENTQLTSVKKRNLKAKSAWTSYADPQFLEDGSVLATKHGMDDPPTLVRLFDDGREQTVRLFLPLGLSGMRAAGFTAVWSRTTPDRRWGQQDFADIVLFDVLSGKARQFTHKAKLFSPVLSADGRRLAGVEFGPKRQSALVVLDVQTGQELERYASEEGEVWREPCWAPDGRRLALSREKPEGKTLSLLDLDSGQLRDVLPYSWENRTRPHLWEQYLLFNSPRSGIDNIYALDLTSNQLYQVTSRPLGAFNGVASGDQLIFQDYDVKGYNIASMVLRPSQWKKAGEIAVAETGIAPYFGPLVIAAVYADPMITKKLVALGVKDSKLLSEFKIRTLAKIIKETTAYALIDDIQYAVRGGRIPSSVKFLTDTLFLTPILKTLPNGNIKAKTALFGKKNVLRKYASYIEKNSPKI